MKTLLRIEEGLMLALAVYLNAQLPYAWWLYWAWFLAPDISFAGYFLGPRIGSYCYNVLHHKGIGIALYLTGLYLQTFELQFAGLLIFGHSAFDRLLGYGLKYPDSFQNTHLGVIGKGR